MSNATLAGALRLKITPALDGYAVRVVGTEEILGVYPTIFDAQRGRDAAQGALAELAATLAKPRA